MTESAGSKSDSFRKTKPMTREDKLALGEPPTVHLGQWLGRDPQDGEIYMECYVENEYESYHDWPYRCEGVVFHDMAQCQDFAWNLSRNQAYRDVWIQAPTGFPQELNWWSEDRMERDGEWTEEGRRLMQKALDARGHDFQGDSATQPTQGIGIDPPARAEANGRRKAYWDPKLKKTIITDEFEEDSVSPTRRKQKELQEKAKRQR